MINSIRVGARCPVRIKAPNPEVDAQASGHKTGRKPENRGSNPRGPAKKLLNNSLGLLTVRCYWFHFPIGSVHLARLFEFVEDFLVYCVFVYFEGFRFVLFQYGFQRRSIEVSYKREDFLFGRLQMLF